MAMPAAVGSRSHMSPTLTSGQVGEGSPPEMPPISATPLPARSPAADTTTATAHTTGAAGTARSTGTACRTFFNRTSPTNEDTPTTAVITCI